MSYQACGGGPCLCLGALHTLICVYVCTQAGWSGEEVHAVLAERHLLLLCTVVRLACRPFPYSRSIDDICSVVYPVLRHEMQ